MASDASHMLEAALEQMDDIIAGTKAVTEYANGVFEVGSEITVEYFGSISVLHLVEDLKLSLQMVDNPVEREALRNQIPNATASYIIEWLESNLVNHTAVNNETYQERLTRLEGDKESLILQVSVLTDQVEAQGDKIRDLESNVEEHHLKLNATEEMLQQELSSRTSLETQKLDLMAEISDLKIKLAGLEKDKNSYEESHNKAESVVNMINELQEQMCKFQQDIHNKIQEREPQNSKSDLIKALDSSTNCLIEPIEQNHCPGCEENNNLLQELKNLKIKVEELENERTQYEWKLKATKAEIAQLQEQLALKDAEIERLQGQISSKTIAQNESSERDQEVQRLKLGMETLLAANEEKDLRIEELTLLLNQFRRVKSFVMANHGSPERILSATSEDEVEATLRKLNPKNNQTLDLLQSEVFCSKDPLPSASSSPTQNNLDSSASMPRTSDNGSPSSPEETSEIRTRPQPKKISTSLEDLQSESLEKHVDVENPEPIVTPENKPHVEDHRYQTLPGKLSRTVHNGSHDIYGKPGSQNVLHVNSETNGIQNMCETENNMDFTFNSNEFSQSSELDSSPHSPLSPEGKKSQKGIKKFWGKIKRTPSGNFNTDDLGLSEFKRGGLRATAGARLSRTKDSRSKNSDPNAPFAQWSNEQVCNWLEDFGLAQYVIFARQWVNSGHTLLTATPQALEKELGIKHPLHRKKLQLALTTFSTKKEEKSAQLDHTWVTRWLDDIGLPQYKDQFHESRVDGRVLQYLTVNDLLFLKVTSQLHHLSIKCAIHVLHANMFHPHCLRRRPADENNISPSEVVQWSNHRVMEWLRSVDLAEYAPNLRGSGVHGGLIILEPRFNADTLAMLLNIPPQKTLLRRHLTTNFNLLIGPDAQQEKREIMEATTYTPLSITAKVRPKKLGLSHFGHLRKKKFDDSTDYVCPVDSSNGTQKCYGDYKVPSTTPTKDMDKVEQMEHSDVMVKQIGAFSEGINNLTNMLSQDEIMSNYRLLTSYDAWR
ncbi:liprin-beta-2 isoform X1 [Pelobates cultripes]|uniref:Liprin-beta-2 isoform X1 n=1 Tax=Pelobates cultripes TaxID=61616 RepID=A0AAD1TM14_PELCU|nr:liprin-beta-2 isoform X1 [Pelobates cultripes]